MLWGWEKNGCWRHGDYFPPWGGWEAFDAAVQETKQKGARWYLMIGPSYMTTAADAWKDGSLKPLAKLDASGNPILVEMEAGIPWALMEHSTAAWQAKVGQRCDRARPAWR